MSTLPSSELSPRDDICSSCAVLKKYYGTILFQFSIPEFWEISLTSLIQNYTEWWAHQIYKIVIGNSLFQVMLCPKGKC